MKILMSAVSIVYFVRSALIFGNKMLDFCSTESIGKLNPGLDAPMVKRNDSGVVESVLNEYGQIDDIMTICYESAVYLLNLWLVFLADDAIDVVLNALAMELS